MTTAARAALATVLGVGVVLGVSVALGRWANPALPLAFGLELADPDWLYLLGLLPFVWLVSSASQADLGRLALVVSTTLRALVLVGLVLALARPVSYTTSARTATALLVDVSDSISDPQLAQAQAFVDRAFRTRRPEDRLLVIAFAGRPLAVALPEDGSAPRVARPAEGGAATDVQAALLLAESLYPPGFLPRAVLVSDGNQTTGDLLAAATAAAALGVRLDALSFPPDRVRGVRVVGLRLPEGVDEGQPFDVVGEVWSSGPTEVTLALDQGDLPNALEPVKTVHLVRGTNRVTFRSEARGAAFTTYRLRLVAGGGAGAAGRSPHPVMTDETVAALPVRGRPRVLYVEGELERRPAAASYLKKALEAERIDVEVRGPRGVPTSVEELGRYDLVIVSDVPASLFPDSKMQAMETYVKDHGGGFVMAGGENSFGSGGYQGTRLEKILPVFSMGEKERRIPELALVLVIDRSSSMRGEKLEMAKESARATVAVLGLGDLVSVVAFDADSQVIVGLQPAANQQRIVQGIGRLYTGYGTDIAGGLRLAHTVLRPSDARIKHVILLTDGRTHLAGTEDETDALRRDHITVSAVGIGEADMELLTVVAQRGGGRLYTAGRASELPQIFVRETEEVHRSSLIEEPTPVVILQPAELLDGTGMEKAPHLLGYVKTWPREGADLILGSTQKDPLLARWRIGLGQTVAWTSDVKNRWAADWLRWPGYQRLWAQLVRSTMRNARHPSYDLSAEVADGRAHVVVDAVGPDDRWVDDLDSTLELVEPQTSQVSATLPMTQTGAGRYEVTVPLPRLGAYGLRVVQRRHGAIVAQSTGAVARPIAEEYLRTEPDDELLAQAARLTGGRAAATPDSLFAAPPLPGLVTYHHELWPALLLLMACAYMVDLYLRRLRRFAHWLA